MNAAMCERERESASTRECESARVCTRAREREREREGGRKGGEGWSGEREEGEGGVG